MSNFILQKLKENLVGNLVWLYVICETASLCNKCVYFFYQTFLYLTLSGFIYLLIFLFKKKICDLLSQKG